jgi:serralysin
MPGTPARSGGRVLAGSGVFAIIAAGAGLATLVGVATPAQATPAPLTADPSTAMPGLPVTFTLKCGPGVKSATFYGKSVGLNGPVAMKSTRDGTYAVTVNLPPGLAPGVYNAMAGCESGDFGMTDLTVVAAPKPSPTPTPPPPPRPTPPPPPLPTKAPYTGDGATSVPGGLSAGALAGLSLLGAGGVAGVAAIRRFRSRD